MARPVQHDVTQVALNTNSGNPTNLGVFQSLDVRAAAPKSAQLASGLADVLGVAAPMMNDYIEKKSEDQTNEGIAAATLGTIDDEKLKKGVAYQAGVEHIETKKMQFDAQVAWQAHYAENVDKRLPSKQLAPIYDAFMKEHLGAVALSNPKLAAKLAPGYLKGMQETIVAHQEQLTKQHIADAEAVMQAEVVAAHERGEPLAFFDVVDDFVGITGDKQAAYSAGIKSIVQRGIEAGDPDLIKMIPTTMQGEDGSLTPNADFTADQREFIARGIEAAEAQELKNNKIARGFIKMQTELSLIQRYNAGIVVSPAELAGLYEEGGVYEQPEITSWMAKFDALGRDQKVGKEFSQLPKGQPYFTKIGTLGPDGEEYTKEDVQKQVNRDVEAQLMIEKQADPQASPEVLMARATSRISETQGFPYEPLKSVFTYAPLSKAGGQVYDNAASAFAALPVSQRHLYVPDEKKRAEFETYLNRRDARGQGKGSDVIDELSQIDTDLSQRYLSQNRKALNEAREKIPAMVLKDGFWNDIEVAELFDAPYAQRVIDQSTEVRVAGGATVAEAQAGALADFTGNHMIIVSPTGEKRSMKRIPGTTEKMGEAVAWMESLLPAVGKIKGVEIPEGARLRVDFMNREDSMLIVVDRNNQRIAHKLRFPAANIERKFLETNPQGDWRKRQQASKRTQNIRTTDITVDNPSMFNTRD